MVSDMQTAKQQISRVRRDYNQWVNNQTLEDYALRFTAKSSRRWSFARVTNTALGAISFLVLEAIGGAVTLSYGFDNALLATLVVGTIIFLTGISICYYAAKYGVDIDLLTRGAGFGYIGSTITSLIYASFTFIFFALEAAIMAKALELLLNTPLFIGYIISSLVVIPLSFYGITFISRFQLWTQPLWVVLQLIPVVYLLTHQYDAVGNWTHYQGAAQESSGPSILLFGAAASVMFSLVAQIGEQIDVIRFLPEKNKSNRIAWWVSLIAAGPGWIIIGASKIMLGSFLAYLAISSGSNMEDASDPTHMYLVVFSNIFKDPNLAILAAACFVILSQLKINVTNAYAGSIAWSNFFSRLTHSHPGRVVWLVFNVVIALVLMELGVYHAFEYTLSIYAIVAVAWVSSLVADLVINKPLGLSPKHIEFKRAHLFNINPVGVGSMLIASILGIVCYLGFFGEYLHALAHFLTIACSFICVPTIALLTKSRYYIARTPDLIVSTQGVCVCVVCLNEYENEDIAHCPAYAGTICSLCCSLDARCLDSCKDKPRISQRLFSWAQDTFPSVLHTTINIRFFHFIYLLSAIATITGLLLALINSNTLSPNELASELVEQTLWKVFFILLVVGGVISWLFVLSHESRLVAQAESHKQTHLLIEEIEAHKKTDQKLQKAKEIAEAANNAKSRYLTGISHELRTPLNAVLGYAQLLESNEDIPKAYSHQLTVIRRSSEHLADLIEGLLDISKIEAGRVEIHKDQIRLGTVIDQIVYMFSLQAKEKGLDFSFRLINSIPAYVQGDEKRLRQILINLLSNAIKFTEKGKVEISLRYKNQVAEFTITDSGVGIPEDEMERIFRPFERVRRPGSPNVNGTGLGLAITRLLVDIMGGELVVKNNAGSGCTFTLLLMLSHIPQPEVDAARANRIYGYSGARQSVMVVDDEASHRGLISDLLCPLGFIVFEAYDGESCLEFLHNCTPDIFLVDRLMPGIDGPLLARKLRLAGVKQPIIMISANANEDIHEVDESPHYDDYLSKPVKLDVLLERIGHFLSMSWEYKPFCDTPKMLKNHSKIERYPSKHILNEIIKSSEIGHLAHLKIIINSLNENKEACPDFIEHLSFLVSEVKFDDIIKLAKAG
ncbi:MAG: signal transduction histidine kinase/DNA-binding NarL/FixJ family response regulator [Flavobacteriales bacterium]|jgi:signal transduction histidine kinase/DNA-binding NarL/FixJ family response regulator